MPSPNWRGHTNQLLYLVFTLINGGGKLAGVLTILFLLSVVLDWSLVLLLGVKLPFALSVLLISVSTA
jgi:hypothetical protein